MHDVSDYSTHLPTRWRQRVSTPKSTFWSWRDHRVHVLRRDNAEAPTRLVLVHGSGAHASALWPFGSLVPEARAALAAVDLPLYGRTESVHPSRVRYADWVDLLCDFLVAEDDGRPVVLVGASMGGLLAHEVAARSGHVDTVVATCLLDPADPGTRRAMLRLGPLTEPGAHLSRFLPAALAGVRIPVSWVANLDLMSRDAALARRCRTDPRGGGVRLPLGFLTSYLRYPHTGPELMRTPLVLTHPAEDGWTPVELSLPWFRRLGGRGALVMLEGCGHFPVEEPGLTTFVETLTALT